MPRTMADRSPINRLWNTGYWPKFLSLMQTVVKGNRIPASADEPMLRPPRYFWPLAISLTLIIFAGIGSTLVWLEFSNAAEALNTATAMEIRRGDSEWLVPSLQGQTRLAKPPLTTWVTALSITDATL